MATEPLSPEPTLDVREQLARIDRIQAEMGKWHFESLKTRQETRFAPITLIFTGMGAAAAFFAAGVAFAKLFTA
jgi:hypothetical protein